MHQPLDPRLQLHEGAVVGDVGDAAGVLRPDRELVLDGVPRIGLQLLHAEADALRLLVDLDDLHLDGLADPEDLARVVDPAPRHVGDVQQAVDPAEIDEGAVLGDVLDHAVDHVALGQPRDDLGPLLGPALLQNGAARHDDVAAPAVHLQDLERLRHVHQRPGVAHRAHVDLAARQERHRAAEVDGEAALDPPEDRALDALLLGVGLLQPVPRLLAARLLAAEHRLAAGVLDAVEIDLDDIADLDLRRPAAGRGEFLEVDPAFHLVADVDDGLSGLDRQDRALDDRPLLGGLQLEALVQQSLEIIHCCRSWHPVLQTRVSGRAVGSAGLYRVAVRAENGYAGPGARAPPGNRLLT